MEEKDKSKAGEVEVTETTTRVARPFRDKVLAGYNKRNPDNMLSDDVDDETLYESLGKGYRDLEMKGENAIEENNMLMDAIANNPEAKGILEELLGSKEGEGVMSDISKRQERMRKDKELQAEFDDNLSKSISEMNAAFDELEATDEERERCVGFMNNVLSGKLTKQMIVEHIQGLRYETDLDEAERAGVAAGKNTVIDEAKLKMRRGDELPKPKTSGSPVKVEEDRDTFFGERLNPAKFAKRIS